MTNLLHVRLQGHGAPITTIGAAVLLTTLLGASHCAAADKTQTGLEQQLIDQGWQTSPDAAGNTLLRPPVQSQSAPADPSSSVAQATTVDAPDLQELLRQRGWVIRESAAGPTLMLLLDPPAAAPTQVQGDPQPAGSRAQDVYRMLEERGWRVRQDASGNTLLIPARSATTQTPSTATVPAGSTGSAMADFRRAVESTGWHVESAVDGSLMMYPPGSAAAQQAAASTVGTSAAGGCPGAMTPSIADGSIGLPIDSETAARRLAREWLAEHGPVGRIVGRLRQVNRIYVASIVDAAPPFQLRNQLVIRRDNGRVIPIY